MSAGATNTDRELCLPLASEADTAPLPPQQSRVRIDGHTPPERMAAVNRRRLGDIAAVPDDSTARQALEELRRTTP